MHSIEVDITLEPRDFTRFHNYFIKNKVLDGVVRWLVLFITFVAYGFNSGGESFWQILYNPRYMVYGLVFIIWLLSAIYSIRYFQIRTAFENDKSLGRPHQYLFSDEGIRVSSDSANILIKWDEVYKINMLTKKILLFLSTRKKVIIPTRAFSNIEDLERLKKLFKEKIETSKLKIKE